MNTSSHIVLNLIFIILSVFFCNKINSQIPAGTWEGNFGYANGMTQPQKIILELSKVNDTIFTGATHLYYKYGKYEHYKVNAIFNTSDSTISISEDSILSVKLAFGVMNYTGTYKMKLECNNTICSFKGKWKTHSRVLFSYKTVKTWFTQTLNAPQIPGQKTGINEPSFSQITSVLDRHSDIQSLIEVNRKNVDTVKLEIYDNGEIDNDSISLYFDETLIVSKQMISTNPITINIPSSKIKAISKLKLIAENQGSIPPCTALMIIKLNNKRYEINLSSNFDKNAVVEFFLIE